MTETKDDIRRDRSALLEALQGAGADVSRPKAIKCPFHDDAHASADVYQAEGGAWKFKCHAAGCAFNGDVFDVRAKTTGRSVEEQLADLRVRQQTPAKKPARRFASLDVLKSSIGNCIAVYEYTHPDTRVVEMVVMRIEEGGKKRFLQARPDADGFVLEAPPKPWPIYNRSRIRAAADVFVVEGEKCVHEIAKSGFVATTSPGGAGKAKLADWSPLAGKRVWIWHDNDPPNEQGISGGKEHMREVAALLERLDPKPDLNWIDVETLGIPLKGDVVDFLKDFQGSKEEMQLGLRAAMETAQTLGAGGELLDLVEDAIAGRKFAVPWPWEQLTKQTRALMPGTVTCLCGDPGSTKSFLLLQASAFWHGNGIKVALYELEEDRPYHLNRLLAQLEDNADLVDFDWIKENPDLARAAVTRHRAFMDDFGRSVYCAPDKQVSLDELVAWVRQMASAGCRVVVIDPVTAAANGAKPWIEDLKFLMECKTIMRQHGASLVIATHPRKGKRVGASLNDLAGGAAYQRFAQTVMWIIRHDEAKNVVIRSKVGDMQGKINRSIVLHKTRNARGAGFEIGFQFYGKSLAFAEQGIVLSDAENDGDI